MPENLAWQGAGMLFPLDDQKPVHKDIVNTLGLAVRVVFEGVGVGVEIGGPVSDAL